MRNNPLVNRPLPLMAANGIFAAVCLSLLLATRASAQAAADDPSKPLYDAAKSAQSKFEAPESCATANCHAAPTPGAKKYKFREAKTDSLTLWSADGTADMPPDPHHSAFGELASDSAKAIGSKMKKPIATPAEDAKCISCHALNPPTELRDAKFSVDAGVSCDACHGPSGKWAKGVHDANKDGPLSWAETQSKALGGDAALFQKFGFYRTRPLIERAERCVSCHLAIDPEMIAAGHKTPMFELNWYSFTYPNRHWNDPHDDKAPDAKFFEARLWASGQVVSLQEALEQLGKRADAAGTPAADLYAAYNQAMAHYTVLSPAVGAGAAINGNMADVKTQVTAARAVLVDPAKRADLAKAAHAAAAAAGKLADAVRAYEPTSASSLKLAQTIANTPMAATLGAFGIEQQRDAVFALYTAYGKDKGLAADNPALKAIQTLFPYDDKGKQVEAKVTAADKAKLAEYNANLEAVKKAIAG